MKKFFQSEDGKIFESESECTAYESVIKNKKIFEKSRFFSSYGSELEKYDSFTHIIYIAPDEFVKMKAYLSKRMRDIKGFSESNIYYLYCMTFYPIEEKIERERKNVKRIEEKIKELEEVQKSIIKKVKGFNETSNKEMRNIEEAIEKIKYLLKESEQHSNNAAMGYDEGWYNGECNAYEIVLEILEEVIKG